MPQQMPFIGRKNELQQIDSWIREHNTFRVLCVEADGGIGKTRLLQEILHAYEPDRSNTIVSQIVDFDNRAYHSSINLDFALAQAIGLDYFNTYLESLGVYRSFESSGVAPQRLVEERDRVTRSWFQDLERLTKSHRVVFLIDTYEKLTSAIEARQYLQTNLATKHFSNTVFIIAGRNTSELHDAIGGQLGYSANLIRLTQFDSNEASDYIKERQKLSYAEGLNPDIVARISYLAEGKPILLEMAAQWAALGDAPEWLESFGSDDLFNLPESAVIRHREDFKRQLVMKIGENRRDIDILTLTMSRIHPVDVELTAELLGSSQLEAKATFDRAREYVFVKLLPDGRISLHDEMRQMVNAYLWPVIDPLGSQRRLESRRAAQYFGGLVERLATKRQDASHDLLSHIQSQDLVVQLETAMMNLVEHALYTDVEFGFHAYKRCVWQARGFHNLGLASQIHGTAREYYERLNTTQRLEFDILNGRLLYDEGKALEALESLSPFLEQLDRWPLELQADLLNAVAVSEVKLGQFDSALNHQLSCVEVNVSTGQFLPISLNYAGNIFRLRGEWDAAIRYYERAFDAALDSGVTKKHDFAAILNNLGYVLGLDGRNDEAKYYCLQAIDVWTSLGIEQDIARAEITLATVYRGEGKYRKAVELIQKALTRLREPDDFEILVNAYFELGWTQWFHAAENQYRGTVDQEMLASARESFDRSLQLALGYHVRTALPGILHQASNVYWLLGRRDEARRMNDEAYDLSRRFHDIRYAVDSILGKAEFDYSSGITEHISTYASELFTDYEAKGYRFPLFYGRMRRILADVDFDQGEFDCSIANYADGIAQIALHGGYGMYYLDRELYALTERMAMLPADTASSWARRFKQEWSGREPRDKFALMVSWCNRQIAKAALGVG
jgi:tetratricopeptide (TPR) repeat protein